MGGRGHRRLGHGGPGHAGEWARSPRQVCGRAGPRRCESGRGLRWKPLSPRKSLLAGLPAPLQTGRSALVARIRVSSVANSVASEAGPLHGCSDAAPSAPTRPERRRRLPDFNEAPPLQKGKGAPYQQRAVLRCLASTRPLLCRRGKAPPSSPPGKMPPGFNEAPPLQKGKGAYLPEGVDEVSRLQRGPSFAEGESSAPRCPRPTAWRGFNEAPPLQKGKAGPSPAWITTSKASFNEAPPSQKGKGWHLPPPRWPRRRFNEAPPLHKGKVAGLDGLGELGEGASTRPLLCRRGKIQPLPLDLNSAKRLQRGPSFAEGERPWWPRPTTWPILMASTRPLLCRRGKTSRSSFGWSTTPSFNEAPPLQKGKVATIDGIPTLFDMLQRGPSFAEGESITGSATPSPPPITLQRGPSFAEGQSCPSGTAVP